MPNLKSLENNKKSKNCLLTYENKMPTNEIMGSIPEIELICLEDHHQDSILDSIYQGDNLLVLKHLLIDLKGKVDLVYIDPPFGTNQAFIADDGKTGYSDEITGEAFLEFLRKRLFLIRELLSAEGSLYLHIDKKMSHYVKIILDEVFGHENYINEITRIKCNPKNFSRKAYGNYSDCIFFYTKNKDRNIWNDVKFDLNEDEKQKLYNKRDKNNRMYTTHPLHAPGITEDGPTGKRWNGIYPPEGRHWRYHPDVLTKLQSEGLIEWSSSGNPRKIVYADQHKGKKPQDIWEYKDKGKKYTTYPTEKNRDLLKFIIENSSNQESIVLDCFAGSFSTLIEAKKLGRKFIGIDYSETSIKIGIDNFKKEEITYNLYQIKDNH